MVNTELKESNPQPKSSKASNRFSWLWTDYSVIIAFIIILLLHR